MAEKTELFSKQDVVYQKSNESREKFLKAYTRSYQEELDKQLKAKEKQNKQIAELEEQLNKAISKVEADSIKASIAASKSKLDKQEEDVLKAQRALNKQRQNFQKQADRASDVYEQNRYKRMSARDKLNYQKAILDKAKAEKKALEEKYALQEAEQKRLDAIIRSKKSSDQEKEEAKKARTQLVAEKQATKKDLTSATNTENSVKSLVDTLFSAAATKSEKKAAADEAYSKAEENLAQVRAEQQAIQEKALEEYNKAKNTADKRDRKAAKQKYEEELKRSQTLIDLAEQGAESALEQKDAAEKAAKKEKTLEQKQAEKNKAINNVANKVNDLVSSSIDALYSQQSRMMSRLQGTDFDWSDAVDEVATNVGLSGVVSQQKVVQKMTELADSGVAYNLEMRAFLAETSDTIAASFSALDSNLLRLIRIQQADSTAARLGLDATLTKLFNQMFEDSSYLADGISDTISSAVLDANASLNKEDSVAFEYTLQKWLGSLYSLGMSAEGVSKIAEGINYLGSGQYAKLTSDESLINLFGMSAARRGMSISDLLQGGVGSIETNELLKSMIEYLAEIAKSTDNVTKSAYADLFGMSVTDLKTFASLTPSEINSLYGNNLNYSELVQETDKQLLTMWSRKNISQIVDTILENAFTGSAQLIGSNAATYLGWKALNILDTLVELEIPGITVLGSGTTSAIDIIETAKAGYVGLSLLGSLTESLFNGTPFGSFKLEPWDASESTKRGSTLPLISTGVQRTTSYSATLGTGSASAADVQTVSFQSAQESVQSASGVSSEEIEQTKEIPEKILTALAGSSNPERSVIDLLGNLVDLTTNIDSNLDRSRVFYTAIVGVSKENLVDKAGMLSTELTTLEKTFSGQTTVITDENKATSATSSAGTSVQGNTSFESVQDSISDSIPSIIEAAVENALRTVLGSYSSAVGNSLSVTVNGGIT